MGLLAGWSEAVAHAMNLQVAVERGGYLQGSLSYSDGTPAAGDYITVVNETDPTVTELGLQTDAGGQFRLTAVPGHRYRLTATGEEGHRIRTEVTLPAAPGGGIGGPPVSGDRRWPPVYVVVGSLMLLSLIPARLLRRRAEAVAGSGRPPA